MIWENLGYSKCNVMIRRSLIALFSILLMIGSFIAIIYAKDYEKDMTSKYNMNTACG